MARSRPLKPSFFSNEALANCGLRARLVYLGMATIADCRGRLKCELRKIKLASVPHDPFTPDDIAADLSELVREGLVVIYGDGKFIAFTCDFKKHARPHPSEESDENIPDPPVNIPGTAVKVHERSGEITDETGTFTAICALSPLPSASSPLPSASSLSPSPEVPAPPVERETPSAMQMDRSRDARELVEVYFKVITNAHPSQQAARNAILYAWDQRPRSTRADFEAAIANYRKHLTLHNQRFPVSPAKFFRDEGTWLDFIDWKPPDVLPAPPPTGHKPTRDLEAERQAMLGKKPPEKPP